MTCDSVRDMLGAYMDGELDANAEFQLRTHLAECPDCPEAYRRLRFLKDGIRETNLYYAAPKELEASIRTSLGTAKKNEHAAGIGFRQWMAIAASVLVALSIGMGLYVFRRGTTSELLAQQVVSSHVRAMIGTHLVDVPSSDQHTVKPWFNGKLDYSPPVRDFKNEGFALVGGRVDYLNDRRVAALVYERRKHVINVFVWPTTRKAQATKLETLNGYNVVRWADAGMAFWVISDLNAKELQQFAALLRR
jgi:anti-sigma factor RsiW